MRTPKLKYPIEVTQQQRDNLLDALNVMWPSVPLKNVVRNLGTWLQGRNKTDCKTVACFGGWCGRWPNFMAQGISVHASGAPTHYGVTGDVAQVLFGMREMFYSRNNAVADLSFQGTDHELVTHRLKWLLENSEVVK